MGQWGFGKNGDLAGTVCLFTGEPGTGKTLAAEAVGFETGKPLKVSHLSHTSAAAGIAPHTHTYTLESQTDSDELL